MIRAFFYAACVYALLIHSPAAFADSYPPVKAWVMNGTIYDSPEGFCNAYRAHNGFSPHESCPDIYAPWGQLSHCKYKVGASPCNSISTSGSNTCPYGGWYQLETGLCISAPSCPTGQQRNANGQCVVPPLECPANTEEVNGQCLPVCAVGYERDSSGVCQKDCTSRQGQATANGSYAFYGAVSTWAVNGCQVYCPVRALAAGGGRGDDCRFTGRSVPDPLTPEPLDKLDPDLDPPPEEPDDCLRRGQGYVSGSNGISCVAPSDAPPGNRPKTENDNSDESGTPGQDGKPDPNSPDYTRNDSTAKNNGDGTVTESGTETRNGNPDGDGGYTCPDGYTDAGNGKCQRQWSKTQDENSFCQQNPKSPLCTGKLNDCEEGSDLARCAKLGDSEGDGTEVGTKQIGVSVITVADMPSGNGCPAGLQLPKNLGVYNWEPICDFATALRPIVVVLAWISAFFIVFGIKGD